MILRVYRARAAAEARGIVLAHLRDHVYPANVSTPGLRTFQAGLSEQPDGVLELALVSTWATFDDVQRGIGQDTLHPVWLGGIADYRPMWLTRISPEWITASADGEAVLRHIGPYWDHAYAWITTERALRWRRA